MVAQLSTLSLALGTLSDQGAAALLAYQPLTHLAALDLHHHYLSEEMRQRLEDTLGAAGDGAGPLPDPESRRRPAVRRQRRVTRQPTGGPTDDPRP